MRWEKNPYDTADLPTPKRLLARMVLATKNSTITGLQALQHQIKLGPRKKLSPTIPLSVRCKPPSNCTCDFDLKGVLWRCQLDEGDGVVIVDRGDRYVLLAVLTRDVESG